MSILIKGMEMPPCCAECDLEGHTENYYGDIGYYFCPLGYKAYTTETREAKRLDTCPLADAAPVAHGKWIDEKVTGGRRSTVRRICSCCGENNNNRKSNYCPSCGAKME